MGILSAIAMSLPATMKAAVYREFTETGGSDSLKIEEVPVPAVKAGQVLVKNAFAAINPIDWKVSTGGLKGAGWKCDLPFVPGYDLSGTVAAVGEGVSGFAAGDEVFAVNWGVDKHDNPDDPAATIGGTFAEYTAIAASSLSKKPKELGHDLAAAVALVGTTAHEMLFHHLKLTSGARVIILGGASAVGQLAVQLSKNKGLWVATTASDRNMDFVKDLGADKVINYTKDDWTQDADLKGVDAVFDTVGEKDAFAKAKTVVKEDGGFVSIASFDAGFDPAAHAPLRFAAFRVLHNDVKVQDELASLLVSGKLKLPIDGCFDFSLDGVKGVWAKSQGGKSLGKSVIKF